MLSEKPWTPQAVMTLAVGVLFLVTLGGVLGQVAQPVVLEWTGWDQIFYQFLLNLVSFYLASLILITLFLSMHGVSWGEFLGVRIGRLGLRLGLALMVGVGALPIALGLNSLCFYLIESIHLTPEAQVPVKILQVSVTMGKRVAFAISAVVLAPLVEETLFRGLLYPLLKQQGHPQLALWVSSILFAAIHLNLMTFIPLTVFALMLVWLYEVTDTLLAPMLAHAIFNLANFFLLLNESDVTVWVETIQRALGF